MEQCARIQRKLLEKNCKKKRPQEFFNSHRDRNRRGIPWILVTTMLRSEKYYIGYLKLDIFFLSIYMILFNKLNAGNKIEI